MGTSIQQRSGCAKDSNFEQSPKVIGQTSQIFSQPVLQKIQSVSPSFLNCLNRIAGLAAREHLKNSCRLIMGKML